jgi:hypothetical protein
MRTVVSTANAAAGALGFVRRARTASRTWLTVRPAGERSSFAVVSVTTSTGSVCENICAMYEYFSDASPTRRTPAAPRV